MKISGELIELEKHNIHGAGYTAAGSSYLSILQNIEMQQRNEERATAATIKNQLSELDKYSKCRS